MGPMCPLFLSEAFFRAFQQQRGQRRAARLVRSRQVPTGKGAAAAKISRSLSPSLPPRDGLKLSPSGWVPCLGKETIAC